MKTLLIVVLAVLALSCSPYQRVSQPVKMVYSIDGILCRDYQVYGDMIVLYDAGYYATKKTQRRVTEVKLIGGTHIIVKL